MQFYHNLLFQHISHMEGEPFIQKNLGVIFT